MESALTTPDPPDKAALRAAIRARRAARISAEGPPEAQAALASRVRAAVAAEDPTAVIAYAALPGEPSLDTVLEELIRADIPVLLPATRTGRPLLLGRATAPLAALPRGTWDIREPVSPLLVAEALAGVADAPAARVLVLTPGLAFDARGARLGNGGGFYDRTFGPQGVLAEPAHAQVRERLSFTGVCWDDEVRADLPVEPWDLAVTRIVTDARTTELSPGEV